RGHDALLKIDEAQCEACHGSAETMQRVVQENEKLPPRAFTSALAAGLKLFEDRRPPGELPKPLTSFSVDHPEFPSKARGVRETRDTLRFNHQMHLSDRVVLTNGSARVQLDCNYCHKVDASGKFHQRMSYEANCQVCHALQFDPEYPQLTVPHGDPATVRAFLNSLQKQYSDLARRERKQLQSDEALATFALEQRRRLALTYTSLPMIEQRVFFVS